MAPLICILLFGMHKYMAGDDERRGARTTVAKAVLFPPLEPILLMEPARRSSETQSHNAEHKAVEWSPAAPARSHARPHHKKPSLPVVNLILLCIGAGIIIIGFACIPYIARLSVVTSLVSAVPRIMILLAA